MAYKALNGPYNWDRYPLAPPGCKAIIYEALAVCSLWASCSIDAWYLGPFEDHYRCNLYYIPETQAYCILGSAKQYPQHCQVLNLSNTAHLKALTKELKTTTVIASKMHKGCTFIQRLKLAIDGILKKDMDTDQRVQMSSVKVHTGIDRPIQQITEVPAIMKTRDPTAKRNLVTTTRTHQWRTRNNTPGSVPAITRATSPVIPPNVVTPLPMQNWHDYESRQHIRVRT